MHFKNRDYSIFKHAVSDYAIGATSKLFILYCWASNFGAAFLCIIMFRLNYIPTFIPILVIFMIISRIFLTLFPTDLEGQKLTLTGKLHYLFAISGFALAYIIVDNCTSALSKATEFNSVYSYLHSISLVSMVSLILIVLTLFKPLRSIFGIVERIYLISIATWFIVFAINILIFI